MPYVKPCGGARNDAELLRVVGAPLNARGRAPRYRDLLTEPLFYLTSWDSFLRQNARPGSDADPIGLAVKTSGKAPCVSLVSTLNDQPAVFNNPLCWNRMTATSIRTHHLIPSQRSICFRSRGRVALSRGVFCQRQNEVSQRIGLLQYARVRLACGEPSLKPLPRPSS